jgi:hypothetical protein
VDETVLQDAALEHRSCITTTTLDWAGHACHIASKCTSACVGNFVSPQISISEAQQFLIDPFFQRVIVALLLSGIMA